MASMLSGILFHFGTLTLVDGVISGAFIWLGFVLTTVAVNNAFTFRRHVLTAIDGGHWLGVLLIIGAHPRLVRRLRRAEYRPNPRQSGRLVAPCRKSRRRRIMASK